MTDIPDLTHDLLGGSFCIGAIIRTRREILLLLPPLACVTIIFIQYDGVTGKGKQKKHLVPFSVLVTGVPTTSTVPATPRHEIS